MVLPPLRDLAYFDLPLWAADAVDFACAPVEECVEEEECDEAWVLLDVADLLPPGLLEDFA